jgi:CHAT domain-containing protein
VWAVTKNTLSVHELPNRTDIEKLARNIYELLVTPLQHVQDETVAQTSSHYSKSGLQLIEKSAELSQMMLGPVADVLQNRRLLIVSDGALRYIPFAALPVPRPPTQSNAPRQTRYLILDHEVVSLPSASILRELRRQEMVRQQQPFEVAVFADPVFESSDERVSRNAQFDKPGQPKQAARNLALKAKNPLDDRLTRAISNFEINRGNGFHLKRLLYTRREAAAIMSVFPNGRAMQALDFQANRKSAMSAAMSRYRIIHFATHALLNNDHPELSGLVLSLVDKMGQPQDGFLQLEDIYNLHLPADLVVLSACDTALGQEIKGEGLIGLTRGFMYAGAMRVVASLWSVDDSGTSELMTRFYKTMERDNLPPASALRAAQIQMLRQQRWKSPFYWAAFQIHGDWR